MIVAVYDRRRVRAAISTPVAMTAAMKARTIGQPLPLSGLAAAQRIRRRGCLLPPASGLRDTANLTLRDQTAVAG